MRLWFRHRAWKSYHKLNSCSSKLQSYFRPPEKMPRPPMVVCYICQREFGTASIGIHEKQCLKKWRDQNNQLPKSQRRPEPKKPGGFPGSGGQKGGTDNRAIKTTGKDPNLEAYNSAASQVNLVACSKCGRKFDADRVKVHQAHCRPLPPKKNTYEARKPDVDVALLRTPLAGKLSISPGTSRPKMGGGRANDGLVPCKICGRTFAPDRIARHQAGCKAAPVKQQASRSKSSPRRRSKGPASSSPPPKAGMTCAKCSTKLAAGCKFCSNCGNPVPACCSQCGSVFAKGAKFCSNCGRPAQANKNNRQTSDSTTLPAIPHLPTILRRRTASGVLKELPNVVCYVCGDEYGVNSIGMHEHECLKHWLHRNEPLGGLRVSVLPRRPSFHTNNDRLAYNHAALISSVRNSAALRKLSRRGTSLFARKPLESQNEMPEVPFIIRSCIPQV